MKDETRGLYLAIILSMVVIFITNWMFPAAEPQIQADVEVPQAVSSVSKEPETKADTKVAENTPVMSTAQAVAQDRRINIVNQDIRGSLRLKGARFDELYLRKYRTEIDPQSPAVELLSPSQTANPYYAEFGWLSSDKSIKLPDNNTVWTAKSRELTPQTPLVLEWNNGQGLRFIRKISVDENYMFTIDQNVENNSGKTVALFPYGLINRHYEKSAENSSVVHEGMIGVLDSSLEEIKYTKLKKVGEKESFETNGGWAGFGDRYWFTSFILNNTDNGKVKFSHTGENTYQVDYVGQAVEIVPGSVGSNSIKFYAGAKEIKLLDYYTDKLNIQKFDLAVDFGWYYFLTKPFFYILDFLYHFIGNMGWAILLFAALLRLVMFPIANKSYESMSKMKKVQPKLKELQEKYKDDKVKLQQEIMETYRKEKINPAAGCLPVLIQIPIFFSLYKVLNIAIEIRHAPFVGWIQDLSAPDPLTISVLTSLPIPGLLDIGVWPILMGISMYIQQKLNPAPANKDQARIFALMPLIFTFMLGHFASGLVIYWTLSNLLSIIQQKAIMHKLGVK